MSLTHLVDALVSPEESHDPSVDEQVGGKDVRLDIQRCRLIRLLLGSWDAIQSGFAEGYLPESELEEAKAYLEQNHLTIALLEAELRQKTQKYMRQWETKPLFESLIFD
jgi:hypothetical protein